MDNNNINKLIIRISALVFLFLGLAVVFVEYWFYHKNVLSEILAIILFTLCIFIFLIVLFILLEKKFNILGLGRDRAKKKQ